MKAKVLCAVIIVPIICMFTTACSIVSFDKNDYQAYSESLPPFILTKGEKVTGGAAYDIFLELQSRTKSTIPVKLLKWDDAYERTLNNVNSIILPLAFIPSRQNEFKWVGPMYKTSSFLYCSDLNKIKLDKLSDAKKYNIAVYKDDVLALYLKGEGFSNLVTGLTPEENAKMLMTSKVQLWAVNEAVVRRVAKIAGSNYKLMRKSIKIMDADLYIGFHHETPDQIVSSFQNQLNAMKKDGSLDRILKKYNLNNNSTSKR